MNDQLESFFNLNSKGAAPAQATVFIYALNDPTTGKCRYIGKAACPEARYKDHLREAKRAATYKNAWILQLREIGQAPVLEVLDEVPALEWEFWEREYIRVFRMIGMRLTNLTDGGDGVTGHAEETRKKISEANYRRAPGRKLSPESKKKIGDAHRGRKHSLASRQNMRAGAIGKTYSEAARQNMSAAKLGKKKSVETRKNMCAGWEVRKRTHGNPNFRQGPNGRFLKHT